MKKNFKIVFLPTCNYKNNISFSRIRHNRILAKNYLKYSKLEEHKPDIIVSCIPSLELAEAGIKYGRKVLEYKLQSIIISFR